MSISDLPPEVIEEIILQLDPLDVAIVSQCSRFLKSVVYHDGDQVLWRTLYLSQPLDDPGICVSQNGEPRTLPIDWKGDLQRITRAMTVLRGASLCRADERESIFETLINLVCFVPPLPSPDSFDHLSNNLAWVAASLQGTAFLDPTDSVPSAREIQLRARLHTYFGLTPLDVKAETLVISRAFVYDMRNYHRGNKFGPFDPQGAVNWVHLRALHHVVSMHIVDIAEDEEFTMAIYPMSLVYTQIVMPQGIDLDAEEDWAGVDGVWRVSFCFCDHRELIRYNESAAPGSGLLDASIFAEEHFHEVFRSLDVRFHVTRIHPDPSHPTRPIIYFVGEMGQGSTSTMNGRVQMTPDSHVRWHFVSGEQGNVIWSSEGVQIGGTRSAYGVLGAWTTVFHDADDPVGPFWLRKEQLQLGLERPSTPPHVESP